MLIGLLIIALGAFLNSSCYVPINKIRAWSWETYWLVQGVFAFVLLPLWGATLAVPEGESLWALYAAQPDITAETFVMGLLWGVGGLTFGLSLRYLGVALGLSLSQGTCAALGTILAPVALGTAGEKLTWPVIAGVIVTVLGICIIGFAGSLRSRQLSEEEKRRAVKDFAFGKGLVVALLCGLTSACFSIGLELGAGLNYGALTPDIYKTLPATLLITAGGFLTNAVYCLYQNARNHTFADYRQGSLWPRNLMLCLLAGALWYSQFFGLSIGKGFLADSPTLMTFSWCILMALNVTWSNVWGIILKEWRGCSPRTVVVLLAGLAVLIVSIFLPQIL